MDTSKEIKDRKSQEKKKRLQFWLSYNPWVKDFTDTLQALNMSKKFIEVVELGHLLYKEDKFLQAQEGAVFLLQECRIYLF